MRVSDWMRYQGFVPTYQTLVERQLELQRQVATGQKLRRASDDVSGAAMAQSYNATISVLGQDNRNLDEGEGWTETTNKALEQATELLHRVRELAVEAGDPTLNDTQLSVIGQELDQLLASMVGLGNQSFRGHYLFAGTLTGAEAFSATLNAQGQITAVAYNGNTSARSIEIAPGRVLAYNLTGASAVPGAFGAFRDATVGVDVFQTIMDLRDHVQSGNRAAISGDVGVIENSMVHVLNGQSRVGSLQSRMTAARVLNEEVHETISLSLSKVAETDIAEAATEIQKIEAAYQAALATGAKLMRLSLVDYL